MLRAGLPAPAADLPADDLQAALLASLRFRPYPEVPGVLRELRAAGKRLVVVSNWDVSLHDVLAATGLDALVDAVLTSAEEGVAKPDPRLFERALTRGRRRGGRGTPRGRPRSTRTSPGRWRRACARCSSRATATPPDALPDGVAAIASLSGLPALAR